MKMKVKASKYIFLFLLLNYFILGISFSPEVSASNKNHLQSGSKSKVTKKESTTKVSQRKISSSRKAQTSSRISPGNTLTSRSSRDSTERVVAVYHVVKKGETLYRIAREYSVSVEDLKKVNNLKTDRLQPGQRLIIPTRAVLQNIAHSRVQAGSQRISNAIPEPSLSTSSEDANFIYHTVQPGETLYRISLTYGVSLEEIRKLNNLESNIIVAGQKLKIPKILQEASKPNVGLERPMKDFRQEEDSLQSKIEKNVLGKNKVLTPSMLSKEDELALKRKFIELSTYYADSRYRLGGNGNGYLDCSSFVKLVFKELGINLPRSSAQQFMVGVPVEEHELIPGDLVFFRTRGKNISHVGIYIGDNRFIHISSSRKRISIDSLDDPYFRKRYAGAKRVLNGEVLEYFQDYLNKKRDTLRQS